MGMQLVTVSLVLLSLFANSFQEKSQEKTSRAVRYNYKLKEIFDAKNSCGDLGTSMYLRNLQELNNSTLIGSKPVQIEEACASSTQRFISLGCSQLFALCSKEMPVLCMCDSNLLFDEAKQSCNDRDQVPECQAEDSTTRSPYLPGVQETKHNNILDAKNLLGEARRMYYINEYKLDSFMSSSRFKDREAELKKDCQKFTTPTYITFGDCFDWFIYCSGNGVNRMAVCPKGETFNKALGTCSETCGVVANETSDVALNTIDPANCQEGQVASLQKCSTGFTQCLNNTVHSKRCPKSTTFETSLVFCVFTEPYCQPTVFKHHFEKSKKKTVEIDSRQAQLDKDCENITSPTVIHFEDCVNEYGYCTRHGDNRWITCPKGETYNSVLRGCSKTCHKQNVANNN